MIGLEDRQTLARDIHVAHATDARLKPACAMAGIDLRTLQRWQAADGLVSGDARPQAVRAHLLAVANEPHFAAVPMLADKGVYLASESTFGRVLKAHGQIAHRGRAKATQVVRPPTTHIATEPRQVWCWDMTYLPAQVMGRRFCLYLILDLYSRKIVGWEVHSAPRRRRSGDSGGTSCLVPPGTRTPSGTLVRRHAKLGSHRRRDAQSRTRLRHKGALG